MKRFLLPSARVARRRVRAARRWWAISVLVLLLAASGSSAHGYVRTRSDAGTPVAWRIPQLTLTVVRPTSAFWTTPETFLSTVQRAAAVWSHEAIPCGDVFLDVDPVLADSGAVRNDGRATVMVTEHGWAHNMRAIALTSVFWRNLPGHPEDGEILDADIELNSDLFSWADIPDGLTSIRGYEGTHDLRSALVHEMGHLLGLWHNCHVDGETPLPDDQGRLSPDCLNVTGDMRLATMFSEIEKETIDKRTLSDDELTAICAIYPYTVQLSGAGCAVAHAAAEPARSADQPPSRGLPAGALTRTLAVAFAFLILRLRRLG